MNETALKDKDYVLVDGRAWFRVGNISIRIYQTGEGVICDMYPFQHEMNDSLASCYAYFTEAGAVADETERSMAQLDFFTEHEKAGDSPLR